MIQEKVLPFLKSLQKNNNKIWFDLNRDAYESSKADFILFTAALIKELGTIDPALANLEAKQCIFRINRDVRFSKNKSPYKQHMAAYFNRDGKKGNGAGYYVHIEPGKSFIAAGIWMPEPAALSAIRQEIDYHFDDFKKILQQTAFKKCFPEGLSKENALMRPPKGYTEDNPALDFLKLKGFVVSKSIDDKELKLPKLTKEISKSFKISQPLVHFINHSLS